MMIVEAQMSIDISDAAALAVDGTLICRFETWEISNLISPVPSLSIFMFLTYRWFIISSSSMLYI